MTKINYTSILIMILLLAGNLSCNKSGKTPDELSEKETLPDDVVEMREDQIKLAKIDTGSVEVRFIFANLKVNGKVTVPPQNFATVSAPLGGFIRSTTLLPGIHVAKGQPLAVIENPEFVDLQESYLESKNKLEYAEAEYNRHSELYKSDVYSEKNLQQVTAEYKNLKAQVSAFEQKLLLVGINPSEIDENRITSNVTIYSPIGGSVTTVNVNTGKSISPTDVLFEIVNTDRLLLELNLFEKDISKVSKGQKVSFFINNETESHEAEVYQEGSSVDAEKTYKVYASVNGICKNVLPGMYVNAIIEVSGNRVTSLPSEAIVSFDDKNYIFTFLNNKEENGSPFTEYKMVEVETGISEGGFTEVKLPAGFNLKTSKVVIKGAYNLLAAKKNAGEMAC